nr:MAG TPA: hypothetical protein [Caudoviricetes sp.]
MQRGATAPCPWRFEKILVTLCLFKMINMDRKRYSFNVETSPAGGP